MSPFPISHREAAVVRLTPKRLLLMSTTTSLVHPGQIREMVFDPDTSPRVRSVPMRVRRVWHQHTLSPIMPSEHSVQLRSGWPKDVQSRLPHAMPLAVMGYGPPLDRRAPLDHVVSASGKGSEFGGPTHPTRLLSPSKRKGAAIRLPSDCVPLEFVWNGIFSVSFACQHQFLKDTVTDFRELVSGQTVFVRVEQPTQ